MNADVYARIFNRFSLCAIFFTLLIMMQGTAQTQTPYLQLENEFEAIKIASMGIYGDVAVISSWIDENDLNQTHFISILDISNPYNISIMVDILLHSRVVAIYQDYLYAYIDSSSLTIYNITNPGEPNFIRTIPFASTSTIEIIDNYMFVTGHPDLTIYSLDDPSWPKEIDSFNQGINNSFYPGMSVDKYNETIAVASDDEGFYLATFDGMNLDLVKTIRLTITNDYARGVSFLPGGQVLALTSDMTSTIYDVSNFSNPKVITDGGSGGWHDTIVTQSGFWKAGPGDFSFYNFEDVLSLNPTFSSSMNMCCDWNVYETNDIVIIRGENIHIFSKKDWNVPENFVYVPQIDTTIFSETTTTTTSSETTTTITAMPPITTLENITTSESDTTTSGEINLSGFTIISTATSLIILFNLLKKRKNQ